MTPSWSQEMTMGLLKFGTFEAHSAYSKPRNNLKQSQVFFLMKNTQMCWQVVWMEQLPYMIFVKDSILLINYTPNQIVLMNNCMDLRWWNMESTWYVHHQSNLYLYTGGTISRHISIELFNNLDRLNLLYFFCLFRSKLMKILFLLGARMVLWGHIISNRINCWEWLDSTKKTITFLCKV